MGYKDIGYRIQIAREEAGLNQKDLADRLGLSQSTLSNYEKGKRRLYLSQLERIAEELGRPKEYFFEPLENPPAEKKGDISGEMGEIMLIISELASLSIEDRKSAIDYIKWLKSRERND